MVWAMGCVEMVENVWRWVETCANGVSHGMCGDG